MNATTVNEAKRDLDHLIAQVNADAEPTIICGDQGQKAVLLSLDGIHHMSVKEMEIAITQLPAEDLAELMVWLENYHAQVWDKQIEEDLEAGRLDTLLAEVDKEVEAGLGQPL